MSKQNLHQEQPVKATGTLLENASAAMVMVHGRGGSAEDVLTLSNHFAKGDIAYLAPQAANYTWYPQRFIAPITANEPYLSYALEAVSDVVKHIENAGIPTEKIVLLGFSQGACLALDYAARSGKKFGGVVALSGGLIGDKLDANHYADDLQGTSMFLGCSDVDFHIPLERVKESTALLTEHGADVTERIYPGMGHTINEDEVEWVRDLTAKLISE